MRLENLSLPLQVKLLSAIQNREITPLGSSQKIPIDIRLITATNSPIHNMVEDKTFRKDLLYRINTILIELPPLRERKDDIPKLHGGYIKVFSEPGETVFTLVF